MNPYTRQFINMHMLFQNRFEIKNSNGIVFGYSYDCDLCVMTRENNLYSIFKSKDVRAIILLKIAMKRRYLKKTLKSRCRTTIIFDKIEFMNKNIPQDLKEYLEKW